MTYRTALLKTAAVAAALLDLRSRVCLLVLLLFGRMVTSQTVCPTQCACRDVTVDCRFRSLQSVADVSNLFPPEVEELDLGDNVGISVLNRTSFPLLTRLQRLECVFI